MFDIVKEYRAYRTAFLEGTEDAIKGRSCKKKIDELEAQGRNPSHTLELWEAYLSGFERGVIALALKEGDLS